MVMHCFILHACCLLLCCSYVQYIYVQMGSTTEVAQSSLHVALIRVTSQVAQYSIKPRPTKVAKRPRALYHFLTIRFPWAANSNQELCSTDSNIVGDGALSSTEP